MSSGNRGNRLRFSRDEDDKLIGWVANCPALYDSKDKYYHDHNFRDETWEEIAKNIGKSVVDCKIRWKSLKDVYRKRKREIADSNSRKKHCKWEHMDALKFLDDVVYARSSASKKSSEDPDPDKPEYVTVAATTTEEDDEGEEDEETKEHQPRDVKIELEEQVLMEESESAHETTLMMTKDDGDTNNDSMVMGRQPPPETRHPIQIFFDSMARTVMGFPPPLAVKTKMEVLQAISKAELELWKEQQQQQHQQGGGSAGQTRSHRY